MVRRLKKYVQYYGMSREINIKNDIYKTDKSKKKKLLRNKVYF